MDGNGLHLADCVHSLGDRESAFQRWVVDYFVGNVWRFRVLLQSLLYCSVILLS